jgi:hypothetical protein
MKSLLPPISHSRLSRSIPRYIRCLSSLCLSFAGLFLTALSVLAMTHAPIVSWIADQRVTGSTAFQTQFFRLTMHRRGRLRFGWNWLESHLQHAEHRRNSHHYGQSDQHIHKSHRLYILHSASGSDRRGKSS